MLVDVEYLLEEMVREATVARNAQAGGPFGERPAIVGSPVAGIGGYGSNQRAMQFAHVRVEGILYGRRSSYVADAIYQAYADPDVSGILLDLRTGGGEVSAAQEISAAVTGGPKPVVTYAHTMLSGGMMAAMGSAEIVGAGLMSRHGSIGVMMSLPKMMAKYYNDYVQDLYADTSPDKNKAWNQYMASLNSEGFKAMLNEIDALFMAEVTAQRGLPDNALTQDTLKGGTWMATEAKRRGLIDSIGNFNYATNRLANIVAANS